MKGFIISIMAFVALALTGCFNHRYINGDLDGQWQIMEIELADGVVEKPAQTYYCINFHTVNLTAVGASSAPGNMQYDKDASTLSMQFPYSKDGDLRRWGISGSEVVFDIRELKRDRLVLQNDEATITCRKF